MCRESEALYCGATHLSYDLDQAMRRRRYLKVSLFGLD